MSDDANTKDPSGTDIPPAQPLCLCGIRGCSDYSKHAQTRVTTKPPSRWRRKR